MILDAAVIGAGVAGSSLAKALADNGWQTLLLDQKPFPRHKVCGEFLSPESQWILHALGLQKYVDSLQPSFMDRTRLILESGKEIEVALPGTALGVSRYSLDAALHAAAVSSGVCVKTSTTVLSVTPVDGGYIIEAKNGMERQTFQARAVVAAWGANGRSGLVGRHPKTSTASKYVGVKSHFQGVEREHVIEMYFFDGGYLGVSPIEGGLVNVTALLERKAFQSDHSSILSLLEAACRSHPKLQLRLADAVPIPNTQAAVAPVNFHRKPIAWSQLPLVGDAILTIPPLCGDGMSMALRSAQLCAPLACRYLSGGISLATWEQEYSQAVLREFRGPLRWGRTLHFLLEAPVLPRILWGTARMIPGLASKAVRATRLNEDDLKQSFNP
ncbi:NAD(P)/FAD-dependent oxidoreductase [Paenibacillus sp. OAS669]|uniref:NAD(P)/FAD-dependent oxidoreductase n=1 Tax=Paenibacillus sp. OAS669 TaxID=2663821 RepID=UPI00178BB488|nr:NAD(P)/FAD-dependent oxidoreductase [Paenibacillus sp. OAS669]MBE1445267.1 flavin-dependent dehydrogenase [Paenibacillus sp. OAS669]